MTNPTVIPESLMTKRDVASYLQCSLRQVELLAAKKRISAPIYLGSASPRWKRSELLAHLDAQQNAGGAV